MLFCYISGMVFSSPIFLFFYLPVVIAGYYLIPTRFKNFFLLIVSLLFYAYGSFDFLFTLLLSIFADYLFSFLISNKSKAGKVVFVFALVFNIGLLGYFKYANFFVNEFGSFLGLDPESWVNVALPLGISFFVFHKISYLVDMYRGKVQRILNPFNYALYIILFPQLIAGPIVRYHQIADQIQRREHSFDKFFDGIYLFSIGLFMKVLIADPLGAVHNEVFAGSGDLSAASSSMVFLGLIAYAFQIYFDFAGYSKIAIGLGKMFGFEFPQNFNRPYLSTSVTEFWRRWHMTLSSFFRDYVYIPLGGNRVSNFNTARNLLAVFLLTGIWHGANWTFFLWGIYFGVLIIIEKFFLLKFSEKVPMLFSRFLTFFLVFIGWILFQSNGIGAAVDTVLKLFSFDRTFYIPLLTLNYKVVLTFLIAAVVSFVPFKSDLFSRIEKNLYFRVFVIVFFLFNSFISVSGSTFHPFLYFRF